MTVIEEDGNRASVDGEGNSSTETGKLEAMQSGSQCVLTLESIVVKLPKPIPNVVYRVLDQGLEVMGDMPVGKTSYNDEFEG